MQYEAHIFPCHVDLATELAGRLVQSGETDFSSTAIITPTKRFQHYLRLALAARTKACIPPHILTLNGLAACLPAEKPARTISRLQQRIILNDVLQNASFHYLRPGMENDLILLFNELAEQELEDAAFAKISALLQADPYRSEAHVGRLTEFYAELAACYQRYCAFLDRHGLIDAAHAFSRRVRRAARSKPPAPAGNFDKIFVLGFSDATAAQITLFRLIIASSPCEFWFHADPALLPQDSGRPARPTPFAALWQLLEALRLRVPESESPAVQLPPNALIARELFGFGAAAGRTAPAVSIHAAASPLQEVKAAAALVRDMVQQREIPPQDIIVAVSDETAYSRLIWSVFEQARIPMNYALAVPIYRTNTGQWLRLFLDLARHDWRTPDLLSLFNSRYMAHWLGKKGMTQNPEALQTGIERLTQKYGISSRARLFRQKTAELLSGRPADSGLKPDSLQGMQAFFSALAAALEPLSESRSLPISEWTARFWQFIEQQEIQEITPTSSGGRVSAYNLELAALKAVYTSVQEFTHVGPLIASRLAFSDFYNLLAQNVFSAEIRPPGQPHIGVQVMNLLEARGIPARVCILLGNTEGNFPKSTERELFLPEPFRTEIGLTTFKKRERLQDQLFYQTLAGFSELHLFYSRQIKNAPAVKSRYLQRLELLNRSHPGTAAEMEEAGRLFFGDYLVLPEARTRIRLLAETYRRIEQETGARRDARGHFPGERAVLFATMSATSMEHLFFCPYRYLLHKLRFSEIELPDEELDARDVGVWLHRVCELFFTGWHEAPAAHRELREPWQTPLTAENYGAALERLQALSRGLMDRDRARLDHLYQMSYVGWPKFLQQEMLREIDTNSSRYELALRESEGGFLDVAGRQIEVTGRVDRAYTGAGRHHIIDYKLRKPRTTKVDVQKGLAPQLPLYVALLAKQPAFRSTFSAWTAEYWALLTGEQVSVADGKKAYISEGVENLGARLAERIESLLEQGQPFFPQEDKNKCRFCSYDGICRRQEFPTKKQSSE